MLSQVRVCSYLAEILFNEAQLFGSFDTVQEVATHANFTSKEQGKQFLNQPQLLGGRFLQNQPTSGDTATDQGLDKLSLLFEIVLK